MSKSVELWLFGERKKELKDWVNQGDAWRMGSEKWPEEMGLNSLVSCSVQ